MTTHESNRQHRFQRQLWALGLTAIVSCGRGAPALDPVAPNATGGLAPLVKSLVDEKLGAVRAAPDDARAHATLGLVYEANEMFDEAEQCFRNAATIDPDEPLWRFRHAIMLRQVGDFDGGLELLRRTVPDMADVPAAHQRLGYDLLDAGLYDEAVRSFEKLVQLIPDRPEGYLGVGEVLVSLGDPENAVRNLQKALSIVPDLESAHYSLGLAFRALGRREDAERELRIGLGAHRPFLANALTAETESYALGYKGLIIRSASLMAEGQPRQAAQALERIRPYYSKDIPLLNNLGGAYNAAGQHQRALEVLQASLAVDDTRAPTHINVARSYIGLGDLESALRSADHAVAAGPRIGATHLVRAEVLLAMEDPVAAQASLNSAIKFDATQDIAYLMLAETCARMGLFEDSCTNFEIAAQRMPLHLPAHVSHAIVLMRLSRLDEADVALRRAERLAPNHERVASVRRELNGLRQ